MRTKKKILIVDDDNALSAALAQRCEWLGFQVSLADECATAGQRIATAEFDGLIIDNSMPGMNGLDFIRELRRMPRFERLPIVLLTGRQDPEIRATCSALGVRYVLKDALTWQILGPELERWKAEPCVCELN